MMLLLLAKAASFAVIVWFYLTAKNHSQPPVQWAVIGLIGFWLAWWAVKLTFLTPLVGLAGKNATGVFLLTQIPAFVAIAAAYFIRKKLLADLQKS
ncbi:hypothetical protein JCM14076_19060 [Methylosoma difficile]